MFNSVRTKGFYVSSEAFPHDTGLFLTGGAGAPLAPLAETPMNMGPRLAHLSVGLFIFILILHIFWSRKTTF